MTKSSRWPRIVLAALAVTVALVELQYLVPSRLAFQFQVQVVERHQVWFPLHIAAGVVTLGLGWLQFSASLRASRPALHRAIGYVYVAAVLVGGLAGLRLAPDTPTLLSQAAQEQSRMETASFGLKPAWFGFTPNQTYSASQFALVVFNFGSLALTWLFVTAMAFLRARQRRYSDHRAWMMRSYALTFAAVTIRLVALPLALLHNLVLTLELATGSWAVNLLVAEWLIRRPVSEQRRMTGRAAAASS